MATEPTTPPIIYDATYVTEDVRSAILRIVWSYGIDPSHVVSNMLTENGYEELVRDEAGNWILNGTITERETIHREWPEGCWEEILPLLQTGRVE